MTWYGPRRTARAAEVIWDMCSLTAHRPPTSAIASTVLRCTSARKGDSPTPRFGSTARGVAKSRDVAVSSAPLCCSAQSRALTMLRHDRVEPPVRRLAGETSCPCHAPGIARRFRLARAQRDCPSMSRPRMRTRWPARLARFAAQASSANRRTDAVADGLSWVHCAERSSKASVRGGCEDRELSRPHGQRREQKTEYQKKAHDGDSGIYL